MDVATPSVGVSAVSSNVARSLIEEVVPWPTVRFAGVRVPRPAGGRFPWPTLADSKSHYEAALIGALRQTVSLGDDVVIVGGGFGVSWVIAAEEAGDSGSVVCFEAAGEAAERAERTVELNGVGERVTVHHSVVETEGSTRGDEVGDAVPLDDVGSPDVLVVDVDGAELAILDALDDSDQSPRSLVVEHHAVPGGIDYHPAETSAAVGDAGYDVVSVHSREIPPAFGGEETVFVGRRR